jgi:ABC-type dipeptide/oligopeptide/nickel transport system permease subunit
VPAVLLTVLLMAFNSLGDGLRRQWVGGDD